jgi:hypothetical protein
MMTTTSTLVLFMVGERSSQNTDHIEPCYGVVMERPTSMLLWCVDMELCKKDEHHEQEKIGGKHAVATWTSRLNIDTAFDIQVHDHHGIQHTCMAFIEHTRQLVE